MLMERRRQPEWMDEPGLDEQLHARALDGLARINRSTDSPGTLWPRIHRLMDSSSEPLRVLDVGAGGGDVVVSLYHRAESTGRKIQIDGCDTSPFAVEYARRHADSNGASACRFFRHDVLAERLPDGYDVAMCSLFLHHFDEEDALAILSRMNAAARRLVLVQDLRRTCLGYALAWAGCRLLSRSPVVHKDGPLSVAGAFTSEEARILAVGAGLSGIEIEHRWPQRFILSAVPEIP